MKKLPLAFCLLLVACTDNQVLLSLDAAVASTEIALPVIAAASGLSPQLTASLEQYLVAVDDSAAKTADILGNQSLSPAQRYAQVTALFAAIAIPELPVGTPQNVAAVINAVAVAVNHFLVQLRALNVEVAHGPQALGFQSGHKQPVLSKAQLEKIRQRAAKAKAKIQAAKKK